MYKEVLKQDLPQFKALNILPLYPEYQKLTEIYDIIGIKVEMSLEDIYSIISNYGIRTINNLANKICNIIRKFDKRINVFIPPEELDKIYINSVSYMDYTELIYLSTAVVDRLLAINAILGYATGIFGMIMHTVVYPRSNLDIQMELISRNDLDDVSHYTSWIMNNDKCQFNICGDLIDGVSSSIQIYTKLIFINKDTYDGYRTDRSIIDFTAFGRIPDNIVYSISIPNGNYMMLLRKDIGGSILIQFIDIYKFGISQFLILPELNELKSIHCELKCNEKCSSTGCVLDGSNPCDDKQCSASKPFTNRVLTWLYILSIYFAAPHKNNNPRSKKTGLNSAKQSNAIERNEDIIKIYSTSNTIGIDGSAKGYMINSKSIQRMGSKQCPHVRCGHYRHYKNGKTVWIDTYVVHKDEYKGPITASVIK